MALNTRGVSEGPADAPVAVPQLADRGDLVVDSRGSHFLPLVYHEVESDAIFNGLEFDATKLLAYSNSISHHPEAVSARTSEEPEQGVGAPNTTRAILRKRNRNRAYGLSNHLAKASSSGGRGQEKPRLIEKALSQSAELYPREIIDPVAYAHRSIEERRQKACKEGKIARPLNSYMLYRKAYQQVARRVLSNDQQQFASQIVGESWNRWEPKHVKAEFKDLAKIDHRKHHEAFPSYKYTPTQGRSSKQSTPSKGTPLSSHAKQVGESYDLAFRGDSGVELADQSSADGEPAQPWLTDSSSGDWLANMSGETHSWPGIRGYSEESEAYYEPHPEYSRYSSPEESLFVTESSFIPSSGDYWNDAFGRNDSFGRNDAFGAMTMSQCIDPSLLPKYEPADTRTLASASAPLQISPSDQHWTEPISIR